MALDAANSDEGRASARPRGLGRFAFRSWAAVFAVGLSLMFSFFGASTASAVTLLGPANLSSQAGICLDGGPANESGKGDVYTNPCDSGNVWQKWRVEIVYHASYDVVMIRHMATDTCLTQQLGVATVPCNGGDASQLFQAQGSGWNDVQLKDMSLANCVDGDHGGNAYMLGCNGGPYQHWKLG
ncbi:ricin-type beta-trefoil lectin domain protein [Streptomyces sp. NPDC002588]|uniref:RICIN domain-containing protein n=1 Tax=Streptomyces sp. NPDC002588 TaxID=3154419 RepID=UPI003330C0C7